MSKVCKKCGRLARAEDQFCMDCGTPLEKESVQWEEMRSTESQGTKREPAQGNITAVENEKVLSMGDYLLMLILMSIPVVNFIVCIVWICSKNSNLNRKNFAKAWLILAVIGTILTGIMSFGLFQFIVMDHTTHDLQHIEYTIPEKEFVDNFIGGLEEI